MRLWHYIKKIDTREIDYIKPNLNAFKNGVKNPYLKKEFLTAYDKQIAILYTSKLSPKSIIHTSENLKGETLFSTMIDKYKGKIVYVDIWATWCAPCVAGMDHSKKLREKLKGKDVIFLYVCIDSPNSKIWKDLIAAKSIEGENYFMDADQSKVINHDFNISSIPRYALINKRGEMVDKNATSPSENATLAKIEEMLGK